MQIAFGKSLLVWFLFSHRKRVFVCSRSFYLHLNEKVLLIQSKFCIETRFSRCLSPRFTVFLWLLQLWICWQEKSFNFSHYVAPIKPRSHRSSGDFSYAINSLHSYICLFSWYFKIVWTQVCFSLLSTCKVAQKCRVNAIVARKRELSQKPNLCFWGAFPQKIFAKRKCPDHLSLYQ